MNGSALAPYDIADPLGSLCMIIGLFLMMGGQLTGKPALCWSAVGLLSINLLLNFNSIEVIITRHTARAVDLGMLLALTATTACYICFVFRSLKRRGLLFDDTRRER